MELNINKKTIIIAAILLAIALLSFFWIAGVASSEGNFNGTYSSLEEKRTNVTELMAATAGSSTAISLLPGDAGTPIADQLADLSGYFMFILAAIYLEKWLVTVTGFVAFKLLIPICCLGLIAGILTRREAWRPVCIKLILFAIILFAVVPSSVVLSNLIDESYKESVQATLEEAQTSSQELQENSDAEDENVISEFIDKVKGGVNAEIQKFENLLTRFIESIALLIVTSCAIPIAVLLFFLWVIKMITGVSIDIPNIRLSDKLKGRRH